MKEIVVKNQKILITKETKGIFLKETEGYKVVEKDGTKEFVQIKIPVNSTYNVVNFNTVTKRVLIFLHAKGIATEVIEVDTDSLIDYSIINNENVVAPVSGILIVDRLEYRLNPEALKMILFYLVLVVGSFIVGKIF